MQRGRVALMRGPMLFCIGKDQNQKLVSTHCNLRDMWLDAFSLGDVESDDSIRQNGVKVHAKVWPDLLQKDHKIDVVFTEFADPSGVETYFKSPDYVEDELFDREPKVK